MNTYSVAVHYGRLPTEMRNAPVEMVRRAQRAGVAAALPYVHRRLSLVTPSNIGLARSSVTMETSFASPARGFVGYSGMASTYIGFVNDGTRPHWPPIAAITLWATRKFGLAAGSPEALRAGYLVARSISRKGTKAQRFVEALVAKERSRVQQMMIDAMLAELHKAGS